MNRTRLIEHLIAQEGLRLKPYRCPAGKMTIGCGRNIDDNGISRGEAMYLLENDIASVYEQATRAFPWFLDLDDVRREVILNMLFNLGLPKLREFKKMLAAIERIDFTQASVEMCSSRWASQVGSRAVYLSQAMKAGEFPDTGV